MFFSFWHYSQRLRREVLGPMILLINNILDSIKDIRKSILTLEAEELTDEQTTTLEEMKKGAEEFDHDTRILEFEINKDI